MKLSHDRRSETFVKLLHRAWDANPLEDGLFHRKDGSSHRVVSVLNTRHAKPIASRRVGKVRIGR